MFPFLLLATDSAAVEKMIIGLFVLEASNCSFQTPPRKIDKH
jgi:hypothetical protein